MSAIVSVFEAPTAKIVAPPPQHWARRPRPIVRRVRDAESLDWDPEARELFSAVDGQTVRAGESFAIVRPGVERWPLGICSDHYQVTSHRASIQAVKSYCGELVIPNGIMMAGHGYHVSHGYFIRHLQAGSVDGAPVISKLVVANDHTGQGAMRSAMVVYVGNDALGSIVRTRGLHVGAQPARWTSEIESMVERSLLAQDALLDLLRAAQACVLDDADRKFFETRRMIVKGEPRTALDAMRAWHKGHTSSEHMTWGVYERRLEDTAILALCALLGRETFGEPLDAILGGNRYGGAR